MGRLTAWASWAARNADGLIALVAALVIVAVDIIAEVSQETLTTGILLVLSVLAIAMLRDREHREQIEQQINRQGELANRVLPALATSPGRLEKVEDGVEAVTRALNDTSMVRVLSGSEVSAHLADARRITDRWYFRGGTGTYTRAVTLPECVENARNVRRTLQIRLEIIDPTNEEVCDRYAQFRTSLSRDRNGWSLERTRRESYATIVACCWYRQRYDLLDVRVGLSQTMPTLRWDLSSRHLVITHENPGLPALLITSDKLLYEYMQTEMGKSLEQARRVPLEAARQVPLGDEPTVDEVRRLFVALGMPLPSTFDNRDVGDIITRALRAENPYR
jgi:hypothetical protein